MCQFSFAFEKLANAWLNLKGRCEDGRGRRAKREGRSNIPKSCLTSEGSGWLLPHIPDHGQTSWMRHDGEHMPTRAQGVMLRHLGCGAGRGDIAFCPFGNLAREKLILILIQPAVCTGCIFLNLYISFGLPPFWVFQAILASTFSQTLHFTFGTPTLFGLQSSFSLSLLSSLPPLFRLCAVSWLSRRRRRSKLVATCWCLARQNSFLSFPVTLGVSARSSRMLVVHMDLGAASVH